jgi:fimbrial chaperone protein
MARRLTDSSGKAVMKIVGIRNPRLAKSACNSTPVIFGICTSRDPGPGFPLDSGGRGGAAGANGGCRRERPPAVELQPAQDYVARVVRVTKKPVEGEEAYRLFIDELPEAPQGQRTVNLVVRHSIPLFFDAPGSSAPEAAWRVTQNGRAVSLSAANGGDRRLRLALVRIGEAAGKGISFGPGLVGYALGHSAMSWTAPGSRPVFRPGAKVTISGLTEAGPFNAQAVVQSAR